MSRACLLILLGLTVARDIQVLKTYGAAPYAAELKKVEKELKEIQARVNEKIGTFYLSPIML